MTVTVIQEVLPDRLTYGLQAGDLYETDYVATGGGFSFKNRRWKRPRKRFTGDLQNMSAADREAWFGFMKTVAFGRANNFLVLDRTDYASQAPQGLPPTLACTDQLMVDLSVTDGSTGVSGAVGDGVKTQFRLAKFYFSPSLGHTYCRLINYPVPEATQLGRGPGLTAHILIGNNGANIVSAGNWTIDTATGIVTFTAPPASGHALTAGFFFYVPVEFDEDYYALSFDKPTMSKVAAMTLTEVRVA